MKVHVFVTMVSKSALKSPNLLPSFTKTAISLNDGITRKDNIVLRGGIIVNSPKTRQKKEEASSETSSCGDFVRWARLELAQAYAHYPLKVACLPFHHHRFFVLGLQRYALFLNFQTFSQKFSNFFNKFFKSALYRADFQDNRPKILSE